MVRRAGRLGVLATLTAVAAGVLGAGPANAADKEVTWKAGFPIIGDQQVKSVIHTEIPATVKIGETVSVPFTIDADAGDVAADGLRLVGGTKISGAIRGSVVLTVSSGQSLPLAINVPIPETPVPPQGPLKFTASGKVELTIPKGVPTGPAKSAVGPKATSHVVTDSGLGEFDVDLALDPPTQDTLLGTTTVQG
ncbi:DUF6801 domain-containing protein [Amycolatopsis sp. NPDC059027]|uniref:DUF6801 domain-containing protein n=1 Tax=unclassified Amycolatopsis TaxID=2618356 RepID=UPI0036703B75